MYGSGLENVWKGSIVYLEPRATLERLGQLFKLLTKRTDDTDIKLVTMEDALFKVPLKLMELMSLDLRYFFQSLLFCE